MSLTHRRLLRRVNFRTNLVRMSGRVERGLRSMLLLRWCAKLATDFTTKKLRETSFFECIYPALRVAS